MKNGEVYRLTGRPMFDPQHSVHQTVLVDEAQNNLIA